jgi:hypothetical protein
VSEYFYARWFHFSEESYYENAPKEVIKQFEDEMQGEIISKISFTSSGSKFTGKKYKLTNNGEFKFEIIASGIVNEQHIILKLKFRTNPKRNADLDEVMLNFVKL